MYQQWLRLLEANKMEDYLNEDEEFWEMVYQEYGEQDTMSEFDNQAIVQILCPRPGIIILFTEEIGGHAQEPYI